MKKLPSNVHSIEEIRRALAMIAQVTNTSVVTGPATTTAGNVPQWGTGTRNLVNGLGVATTLANPGVDTKLATEKAIRTAITAATHTRLHSIIDPLDHSSAATPGKMLKADANGLPVDATNTDAEVADAVTKKHTQNTDQFLDQGGANQSTAADVKDAVTKKHTQGTDQHLDFGGANQVAVADAKDAVDKKHVRLHAVADALDHSGIVTAVGDPGSDSQVPTEKAVRTAVAVASAGQNLNDWSLVWAFFLRGAA